MSEEEYELYFDGDLKRDDFLGADEEKTEKHSDDSRWCNTCEFKHLESECLGCAEYDEYDNLINLHNYKKEE